MTLLFSLPPLLCLLGFYGLALFVCFRGERNQTNRCFIWICVLSGLLYLDILFAFNVDSETAALWASRLDHLFLVFLVPLYLQFFHGYLGIRPPRHLIPAAYVIAFVLMVLAPTPLYIMGMERHVFGFFAKAGPLYSFFGMAWFATSAYVSWLVYRGVRRERQPHRRKQLWFVFVGFGGLGILNGLNFFTIHGAAVYPPGNLGFIPLSVFAYGLFRHDLLNMEAIINTGLVYSFLTACMTGLYALIVTGVSVVGGVNYSESPAVPVVFFIAVTLVIGPLKTRIQKTIDRLLFREKYDYRQTLKRASQMIVSVLDINTIGQTLIRTVGETMQVEACRLMLKTADGAGMIGFGQNSDSPIAHGIDEGPLLRRLQRENQPVMKHRLALETHCAEHASVMADMARERVEIAIPLVFKGRLNGYFLLGRKRSGDPYSQADVDLLETLSGQSALAVENAIIYQKVDELNNRLEQKVAARTRSLERALIEKERTQEALVRSESLAAIGQLVAGVAHELNNPLASTVSLVQTTIEDLEQLPPGAPLDEDTIDDLKFADQELRRAGNIVKSLLGLSRQTDTYTEKVALNTVIQDALRVLHNQYKHRDLRIKENYSDDLPVIPGNFAGLGQVVLNIVQNAIQAVDDDHATVELITEYDSGAGQVIFKCIDTGPGIPASIRQDIFKPFFTTKDPGKGTGLGLYICHEIVRRHGGVLDCSDQHPGGAGFIMALPVAPDGIESAG